MCPGSKHKHGMGEEALKPKRELLHVDDDPLITRVVGKALEPYGYQLSALHDPCEAINELVHGNRRIVLLDINMPGMNGLELLKEIKRHDGGIQVIMLTGLVTVSSVLESFRLGAEAIFFKPLKDVAPLCTAVERTFQKIDHWWDSLDELTHRKRSGDLAEDVESQAL
jgi:DNA-binding NtrC family response regulator